MREGQEIRRGHSAELSRNTNFDLQLQRKGIPTAIPTEINNKLFYIPGEKVDSLTGLPIETDDMRTAITKRLGEAIKNNEKFACLYTDSDNLKTANYIDHDLGNSVIKADAARVGSMLQELNLDDATIYLVRQSGAADETVVWLFGLSEEQLEQLKEKTDTLNRTRRVIEIATEKDTHEQLTISTTAALIDSDDPSIAERSRKTTDWMRLSEAQGREVIPRNDFREIKRTVEDKTKLLKIAKDIARLPIEELGIVESRDKVKRILAQTLANSRVSEPLVWTVLTIMEQTTIMENLSQHATRALMHKELGIEPQETDELLFTDEDLRVMYFDSLLHKIYESAGIDTSV